MKKRLIGQTVLLLVALWGLVSCDASSVNTFLTEGGCVQDSDCPDGKLCEQGLCVENSDVGDDDDDGLTDGDDPKDDDDDIIPLDDDDDDLIDGDNSTDDDDDDLTDGDSSTDDDDDDDFTDGDSSTDDDDDDLTDGDSSTDDDDDDDLTDGDNSTDDDDDDDTTDGDDDLCLGRVCPQDDNPCTVNECDPADGQCKPTYNEQGVCPQGENPCMVAQCDETQRACVEEYTTHGACPQDDDPCTRHVCRAVAGNACAPVPANEGGSCDDGNLCNGTDLCEAGLCVHEGEIECGDCFQCDPDSGSCVCDESCGSCDESGFRVELTWSRDQADLDLHVLRSGGIFEDENDCYIGRSSPDWGVEGVEEDNPQFGDDVRNGQGEDVNPETVTLAVPRDGSYRVLVHYYGRWTQQNPTTVWVKVYFDGVLVQDQEETMNFANSYWNATCLNYELRTASSITNNDDSLQMSVGDLDDIDPTACMGQGVGCESACDCSSGLACVGGRCAESTSNPIYCCGRDDCPAGLACENEDADAGYCQAVITFNRNPEGQDLGNAVTVESMFGVWGVLFDTDLENAVVATNSYQLSSSSRGNSCATLDANGQAWQGNIHAYFVEPSANATMSQPAETSYASFYLGDTRVNDGLRVRAYNLAGDLLTDFYVDGSYFNSHHFVEVNPSEPMHHVRIDPANDPDFTMDDFTIAPLYPATP